MESLSETNWDVLISGTGLQQSILALSLSRSKKKILHVDTNDYYGGAEAALSLQDADEWTKRHASGPDDTHQDIFSNAASKRSEGDGLSFSRSYSIALAPQIIHARSELLAQLISSKAFRQLEFLAVGSFYICSPASDQSSAPSLDRIPSTREDVFTNTKIPSKSKRSLMKFLKFVLDYDSEPQTELWKPKAAEPLADFLASAFKLDKDLQSYVVTLTLSKDGNVSVEEGLKAITRHLSSMGRFGAGFAAVYPKWGGLSEITQIGCRAAAVGGATYILGSGVKEAIKSAEGPGRLNVTLHNHDASIKTRVLVQCARAPTGHRYHVSRLTAIVASNCSSVFQSVVDGAPTPALSVVAFPSGTVSSTDGIVSEYPIYATVHSSDTGECPVNQCVIYFSTLHSPSSASLLKLSLLHLLSAIAGSHSAPKILYELSYEQESNGSHTLSADEDGAVSFAFPPVGLAFDDGLLDPVKDVWKRIMTMDNTEAQEDNFMLFEDREGVEDDNDL